MRSVLTLVVALACVSIVHAEVAIETVTVGNPGNPMDTGHPISGYPGFGGVDYTYNIGKFEVTAGQYTEFLNAVAGVSLHGLYNTHMWLSDHGCKIERFDGCGTEGDPYQYRVADDQADRPVNYVSWGDAARFANWLHNGQPTGAEDLTTTEDGSYFLDGEQVALMGISRALDATWVIPSEDEWYKAAYYDGGSGVYYDYPTSSDSVPSNDLVNPDPGNNATFADGDYTIGSPYFRTVFGAHQDSDSPYGTFDQGGNITEWNDWTYAGQARGLRGGSYFDSGGLLHAAIRYYINPTNHWFYIGFRVAKVSEQAPVPGDFDDDQDVDLHDYALLQDVELHDFAFFQVAFTGPQ